VTRIKRSPLDDIAPYPRSPNEATAEALIKHHIAFGLMHDRIAWNHSDDRPQWDKSLACVVSSYTAALLLMSVREHAGAVAADQVARNLWLALEAGELPPELWTWAQDEGLDPQQIKAIGDQVTENIRAMRAASR
jgi:hypothetical protein